MPTPFRKTEMFSCLCIEERTSGQSPVRSPQNASLAQLAEHVTVNHGVVGSSPSRGAKKGHRPYGLCPFFVVSQGLEPLMFCRAKHESVCGEDASDLTKRCRKPWFCSPSRGAKTRRPPVGVVFLFRLPTGSNHSCFAEQNMKVFAVRTLQI